MLYEGLPRKLEAARIGNRLAQGEFPVDMLPVLREGGKERADTLRVCLELAHDSRTPPAVAVAVGVVLTPDIVEAVRHFVPADAADAAVVARDGLRRAVEGRLQDACRDEYAIHLARVVRVDICART